MDVKDVQIDSRVPAFPVKEDFSLESSGSVADKPESSSQLIQDKIDVSEATARRSLNGNASSKNQLLEHHNKALTSLNVTDDQASKISALLRSAAGIATQVSNASTGQVDKLQQELNSLLSEIQNVGTTLRQTSVNNSSLDGSVQGSVINALSEIAPEPPSQPPKLVLLNKAGVLATQHAVAKSQAQFAALKESILKATDVIKESALTLRGGMDSSSESVVKTPEEAFKLTTVVVKEALENPIAAVHIGVSPDARITI